MRPGPFELLILLAVLVLLFGARRLPELARSLGKSLSEFKKGREEGARLLDTTETSPGADEKVSESESETKGNGIA